MPFSELHSYLSKHPLLTGINKNLTGLEIIAHEYSTLSKAVHASAANFRMTGNASEVLLWSTIPAQIGMWQTREKLAIEGICMLLITLFRTELEGARNPLVREILFYAISASKRQLLKKALSITISKP